MTGVVVGPATSIGQMAGGLTQVYFSNGNAAAQVTLTWVGGLNPAIGFLPFP
jgi:hypothetical protein